MGGRLPSSRTRIRRFGHLDCSVRFCVGASNHLGNLVHETRQYQDCGHMRGVFVLGSFNHSLLPKPTWTVKTVAKALLLLRLGLGDSLGEKNHVSAFFGHTFFIG